VLESLHALSDLPEQIEKAQFEWVDGLLIRALQRGDWLVLDNANLCSSSVLDRLNSLLEPHGYLSINEHPREDGEPRIVVPQPGFRIFFTMDPRNGELSRAMRNRSIELHMIEDLSASSSQAVPIFGCEAAMSRYRTLMTMRESRATQYAADHLSFEDLTVHDRFVAQLQEGLGHKSQVPLLVETLGSIAKLHSGWLSQAVKVNTSSLVALSSGAKQVSSLALFSQGMYTDVSVRVYSLFTHSTMRSLFAIIAFLIPRHVLPPRLYFLLSSMTSFLTCRRWTSRMQQR
jgi:hypothetical protein